MGIPKYFSFIIKNYPNIIKNLDFFNEDGNKIHTLFLDSNSIIYDCVHKLDQSNYNSTSIFEDKIITDVIIYIDYIINLIKPYCNTYITFDGMPPFPKMQQQRHRRLKTAFYESYKGTDKWSLNNITPCMDFMKKLSKRINKYYENKANILCSCSDELGEGEHKIMEYIRNNNLTSKDVAIYGLDSDLIMLSLVHLRYCGNIYVFREAPEFLKSKIPAKIIHKTEIYFVDIRTLGNRIPVEMGWKNIDRMLYEYVFLCFFLGNDFLPHILSINIHTNGFDILFDAYKKALKENDYLVNTDFTINWKNYNKLFKYLTKNEYSILLSEFENIALYRKRMRHIQNDDDNMNNYKCLLEIPEKYVNVTEDGWRERLNKYRGLDNISNKYCNRLNWVLNYYINGVNSDNFMAYEKPNINEPMLCEISVLCEEVMSVGECSRLGGRVKMCEGEYRVYILGEGEGDELKGKVICERYV